MYHCTYINSYSPRPIIQERFVHYTSVQNILQLWDGGCSSLCSTTLHLISLAHHFLKIIRSIFNITKKLNTHTMPEQKCSPLLLFVHFVTLVLPWIGSRLCSINLHLIFIILYPFQYYHIYNYSTKCRVQAMLMKKILC